MTAHTRTGTVVLARLRNGLTWILLGGLGVLLCACVVVPRLAGATTFTVLTGSMRPSLPPGTLVAVRPVSPDGLGIGSVVTYQLASGEPQVVTHRVVALRVDATGRTLLRTQGDANSVPDPGWVRYEQVRGTAWYAVPYVGHLNSMLEPGARRVLVLLSSAGLLTYACAMFVSAARRGPRTAPSLPARSGVRHG